MGTLKDIIKLIKASRKQDKRNKKFLKKERKQDKQRLKDLGVSEKQTGGLVLGGKPIKKKDVDQQLERERKRIARQ